jgi:putative flippase GtrA
MTRYLKKGIRATLYFFFPSFRNILSFEVYAYLAVGAANTVLNISVFALFCQFVFPESGIVINYYFIASYTASLIIAFLITVPTGFWLSKHFAFANKSGNAGKQLWKYFVIVLIGLFSDYLILRCLVISFNIQPTIAKIISTVVVLTANYFLQKYFTFRTKKSCINDKV